MNLNCFLNNLDKITRNESKIKAHINLQRKYRRKCMHIFLKEKMLTIKVNNHLKFIRIKTCISKDNIKLGLMACVYNLVLWEAEQVVSNCSSALVAQLLSKTLFQNKNQK